MQGESDRACWSYKKGECQHADKCAFSHTSRPAAGANAKPKPQAKAAAAAILKCAAVAASTFPTLAEATEGRIAAETS